MQDAFTAIYFGLRHGSGGNLVLYGAGDVQFQGLRDERGLRESGQVDLGT